MAVKKSFGMVLLVAMMLVLAGCATVPTGQPAPFTAQPIAQGAYVQKADNLVFMLDASSSMLEGYNNVEKFALARNVVAHFNQTMPDLNLQTWVRSFGHDAGVSPRSTMLVYGPAAYSRTGVAESLKKLSKAGGPTPAGIALNELDKDLTGTQGKIAVIMISDFKDITGEAAPAADALKKKYGDRLCIYTVMVGDNPEGKVLLEKIASQTACGKAISADAVANGAGMTDFVKTVLIAGEMDTDGDGVFDSKDRCPNTPKGTSVDEFGCPPQVKKLMKVGETYILKGVNFETNKADLKPNSYPDLDEVAARLNAQPDLKIQIAGHTDSTGKREYNIKLSQRRAESVMKYLSAKGVAAERMTATGFGPDRPMASNDTAQGRAENRRVEFKPIQ
ncbi:MAG: OmpA family protein [Desulfatitalea sp.]|nr:OmpA family protein [Desulfatitalea sp.]